MSLRSLAALAAVATYACSQGALEQPPPRDVLDAGVGGPSDAGTSDAGPHDGDSPSAIELENRNSGDRKWNAFAVDNSHSVEAYADRISASAGDRFQVMASS